MFQSSPTSKGGCDRLVVRHVPDWIEVSILTHLEGWVRPGTLCRADCRIKGFNPHPPRRVGATGPTAALAARPGGFNPHPPRRVGATIGFAAPAFRLIAFQSSPTSKGGCDIGIATSNPSVDLGVSILTHLEGWVRRGREWRRPPHRPGFNPHPPRRVGATRKSWATPNSKLRFNPHPPRRVGATRQQVAPRLPGRRVSILTHLEGWVRQRVHRRLPRPQAVSILTHLEGWVRLPPRTSLAPARCKFQSSPTSKWVRPGSPPRSSRRDRSFNPHPPRRVGATTTQSGIFSPR